MRDPRVGAGLREVLAGQGDVAEVRVPDDGVVDVLARVELVRPDVRLVGEAHVLGNTRSTERPAAERFVTRTRHAQAVSSGSSSNVHA